MFRKLYLKNFKVWGDQLWDEGVELAPVTLLLGTNSAGKTSLLQALLLLKQTFQSSDPTLDLNLGGQQGDLIDFGTYQDIVHDHEECNSMGFRVAIERGLGSRFDYSIDYLAEFISQRGVPVTRRLTITRSDPRRLGDFKASFGVSRAQDGAYIVEDNFEKQEEHENPEEDHPVTWRQSRRNDPERSLFLPWRAIARLRGNRSIVQMTSNAILHAFRSTYYLGPLRDYPKRNYLWTRQRPGEIGPKGELAIAALLASAHADGISDEQAHGVAPLSIVNEVSRWLRELGIADGLDLKQQGSSRFYDVVILRDGKASSLVDVGFGVSQVLPMLVMAYYVPRGSTIIAEQPEIHLHPLAQSALADLMVEVARDRRVQFIVETHSEHMFRRLQSLIAEDKVTRSECRLYFAKRDDSGDAILEQLRADQYGKIENWPKNFFGDAIGETERQMRRMIERMKQEKGGLGNA